MELATKLEALADKVRLHSEVLETEEAAKTALVMPFIRALGYDVFDPKEVVPEFTCDVGTKKGEKVDYAICVDGEVSILVECKSRHQELSIKHASQLYRYYSVTDAKFAILTNGAQFNFYTDLNSSNRMDEKPFFSFDLCDLKKSDIRHIAKFQKAEFNLDAVVEAAASLQLEGAIVKAIESELQEPSHEMIRLIAGHVTQGRLSPGMKSAVARHIPNAFNAILRDRVSQRLSSAMNDHEEPETVSVSEVETTADELEGYRIVRAIASELVDPSRVVIRDSKSYCAVLLDDNNRKPIARLRFNSETTRYLGTFDKNKEEHMDLINQVHDIFLHKSKILDRVRHMLQAD